jgi:hypothetical protein
LLTLSFNQLVNFLPKEIESKHRRQGRTHITIWNSPSHLNLLSFFQHQWEHPKRITLGAKIRLPFTVPETKVAKGSSFLDNFVMRESNHETGRHILDPDKLEIPRMIVDVHVAQHPFSLPPIPPAEFKAVIEGPATRASEAGRKLTVDPALTEALMHDAEGADALPLLAFTLERLYVEYRGSGRLRRQDYEALGGVRSIVSCNQIAKCVDLTSILAIASSTT